MADESSSTTPSNINDVINRIIPSFEDNLKRAFRNQAIRIQRKKPINFIHRLEDVFLNLDETKIQMQNLKFQWIPDFRINTFSLNLHQQCLMVNLYCGNLRVEGQYEANNLTLQRILPVSHIGKIRMTFQNVKAYGRIGLKLKEDSLVPLNYDLNYQSTDVLIRVNYHIDSENEIENEISNSIVDSELSQDIWKQLNEIITNLFHRQLAESLIEFSICELMLDHKDEFSSLEAERALEANRLLDSLLCSAKNYLVGRDVREVPTPSFDVIYKGKPLGDVHQGWFATGGGYVKDLTTLTRKDNFHIYEEKNIVTLYGNLQIADFKHGYEEYEAEYDGNKINGNIKASIYNNKLFLRITIEKFNNEVKLDLIQLRILKDIDVDASNLGSLSWLSLKVESWVKGNLRFKAVPVVENHLRVAFREAIFRNRAMLLSSTATTT